MANAVTMYSAPWCGHCRRLARQLDEAGIAYEVVDVDEHPQAGERIVAATGGYRTIPTLDIAGELLVNPSLVQVQAALGG